MFRTAFTGFALVATLAAAAPAFAADPETRLQLDKKTGEYCAPLGVPTGSIMLQRECHTIADWTRMGQTIIDPAHELASR